MHLTWTNKAKKNNFNRSESSYDRQQTTTCRTIPIIFWGNQRHPRVHWPCRSYFEGANGTLGCFDHVGHVLREPTVPSGALTMPVNFWVRERPAESEDDRVDEIQGDWMRLDEIGWDWIGSENYIFDYLIYKIHFTFVFILWLVFEMNI